MAGGFASAPAEGLFDAGASVLDGFCVGDVFFASPGALWHARGRDGVVSARCQATRTTVRALFARALQCGVQQPRLFGLIPFDARRPASLTIPLRVVQGGDLAPAAPAHSPAVIVRSEPVPTPADYGVMVSKTLDWIAAGRLQKIVLARAMDVTLDRPLDVARLLSNLLSGNRHGYTFALPLWDADKALAGMMVGASPELLVRRTGDVVHVNPLAGSIGRHPDPSEDSRLRAGLAASEKDLREHAYVVADIARILREHCAELQVPAQPSVTGTDTLWHLSTMITGRLRDAAMSALDLACALHPTPAVCGTPTAAALHCLPRLEPFARDHFAGLVGWQSADGDGEWALTLRCARLSDQTHLRLYAGAGIVAGSKPEQEIVETATKMETFLRALR